MGHKSKEEAMRAHSSSTITVGVDGGVFIATFKRSTEIGKRKKKKKKR